MELLQGYADMLVEMSAYEEAVRLLDQAIEIDPGNSQIYSNKGWALQYLGKKRAEESRQAYESASELRPDNPWIHTGIADALRIAEDYSAAAEKYRWVVERIEAAGRKTADLPTLGWCYYQLGDYKEAEQIFRQVIEADPEPISDYFDLGLVLLCQKKSGEAIRFYKKGIDQLRRRFPERRRLGLVFVALEDLREIQARYPDLIDREAFMRVQGLLDEQWKLAFGEERGR